MEAKNNGLAPHLQDHLRWHKARVKFLDLLIISLIRNRSVNFCKNAASLSNRAPGSNLRRIQRFFAEFAFDFDAIARLLMAIMPFKGPYQLTLDRTNWKYRRRQSLRRPGYRFFRLARCRIRTPVVRSLTR